MKHYKLPIGAVGLLLLAISCIKDVEVDYGGTFALPLADITFVIEDLLDEDSTLTVDGDNSLRLIHREDNIVHFEAADFLDDITEDVKAKGNSQSAIGEIELDNRSVWGAASFQEFLDEFNDPFLEQFFENNSGTSTYTPAFSTPVNKIIDLPTIDDYTTLTVDTGLIRLTITNELFIDLNLLTVIVHDDVANQDLGSFSFSNIPPGMSQSDEFYVINRQVSNQFSFRIPELSSQGSTMPVFIDLNTQLKARLDLIDFQIVGGSAVLPSTAFYADTIKIDFNPGNEIELTEIDLLDADLDYSIQSDFPLDLEATFVFPYSDQGGHPITHTVLIPMTGFNDSIVGKVDFSGAHIFLNQDMSQPYNRLIASVDVKINNPPNIPINFDASAQVSFRFEMQNFEVEKVFGYFGQFDEMIASGNIDLAFDFDFLDENSEPIYFDNPVARVESFNSFGIPISAVMDISGQGLIGASQMLNGPDLNIDYPKMDMVGETIVGEIIVDKNNSNIVDFLSTYIQDIVYSGNAFTNPNGNTGEINFVTNTSELTLHAELDLPFKFKSEHILYRDTTESLSLNLDDGLTIEDIAQAELKLLYENGLPLQTTLNVYAQNTNGGKTLILDDIQLESASVNAAGRVDPVNIKTGELFIPLTQDQIRELDQAAKNIFEIKLQSANDGNTPVDILSTYGLNLKVGVKVEFGD